MPIIREMIFNRKIRTKIGLLISDDDDPATQYLLSTISRNQKDRYNDRETIPAQVLEVLWNWGIKLESLPPRIGMSRERVCEALWNLSKTCPDSKTGAAALYLFEDTVRDIEPRRPPRPVKFIKRPREKAIPRYEFKRMPGTIF